MRNKMHGILLPLMVLLVIGIATTETFAQMKGEVGLRFMPTVSSFDVQTSSGGTVSADATLGYGAGLILGYNFTDHVGIQGEVIYSTLNQKYTDDNVEREIKLEYINIPLLFSYNTGKSKAVNFNVVAGPQIGISVGSELFSSDDSNPDDAVLSVKKGDLGFAYGAGFDFGLNTAKTVRLGVGFRGVYGLLDISDNSNNISTDSYYVLDKAHVKTYSAYLGVSFLF